jgi:DNA-3-methyladenine glycosylase
LLGARLVRADDTGRRVARIVEVEAYIGRDDQASHARFGMTARNQVMFGPPGRAYVYLVYGMYDCLNVVTEPDGSPAAVLIRAVEPLDGIERMRRDRIALAVRRHRARTPEGATAAAARIERMPAYRLTSGPGLVSAAFGIDTGWTGLDLCDPTAPLRLEALPSGEAPSVVGATERIGIDGAGLPWTRLLWRFSVDGHPSVSGPASAR